MKKFFAPAMLALLLFTAGCDKPPSDNPPEPPAPTKPAVTKPEVKPDKPKPATPDKPTSPKDNPPENTESKSHAMNIKVYYPDDSGMRLVEVDREITFDDANDKYIAAVETMCEDPVEENLTRIFPKNAYVKRVTLIEGTAIVDFDGSILKSFVGGSTGEEFLIASIVDTLTNFSEVKRVKFLVDGQEIETLSG
ncbi:MAG: GerMN domain-containing protein, partial [Selenomonadaceae bacterium]|nr:GerMN domain-containing protein [Selenomonadaceae bacterium]